jgi:hypothetical protein
MRFPQGFAGCDAALLFVHPATTLQLLLAKSGAHVICAASRFAKFDASLIIDKVACAMDAWVCHAREVMGYDKVRLCGWSSGAALSLFHQSQAEKSTITAPPPLAPPGTCGRRDSRPSTAS